MWIWVGGNVGNAVEQSLYTVNMYYDHCSVKSCLACSRAGEIEQESQPRKILEVVQSQMSHQEPLTEQNRLEDRKSNGPRGKMKINRDGSV